MCYTAPENENEKEQKEEQEEEHKHKHENAFEKIGKKQRIVNKANENATDADDKEEEKKKGREKNLNQPSTSNIVRIYCNLGANSIGKFHFVERWISSRFISFVGHTM